MEKVVFVDQKTGEEITFAVEEETQVNGIKYLLVSDGTKEEESEAYILKEIRTEEEEILYEMVEEDVEFAALAKVFAELCDEETNIVY